MIKYALGCACSLSDLLINFRKKYFTPTLALCHKYNNNLGKKVLIKLMFKYCLQLVVEDIINRNVTFWLPLNGVCRANMHMQMFEGEPFQKLRQHHKWANVDFIKSNFRGYQIGFYMFGRRVDKVKRVYVSVRYRDLIDENTNKGKAYGEGKIDTRLNDYLPLIYDKYPWIPKSDIKKTLTFVWRLLYLMNARGADVHVKYPDFWMYFGDMIKDTYKNYDNYRRKLIRRLRIVYSLKRIPWDGYYYFAITLKQYDEYVSLQKSRGRKRKYFTFEHVFAYRLKEECKVASYGATHIFRIPYTSNCGYRRYYRNLTTERAEFIESRSVPRFKDILTSNEKYLHL